MKVYIDSIFLLNFLFDTLILLTVSLTLKRKVKMRRIILGGVVAALGMVTLFLSISNVFLFIIKIVLMIFIVVVTFGYKNFKYTFDSVLYFFIINIVYGGFLYYLNIEFTYKNIGFMFFKNKLNISYMFLLVLSPIVLYIYYYSNKKIKYEYSLFKSVDVYLKNGMVLKLNGYVDTANNLVEPYSNKMVIICNSTEILKNMNDLNTILVPYNTIDSTGLMKCIVPRCVYIEGYGTKKNIVVGFSNRNFNIEGVNCILNGGIKC